MTAIVTSLLGGGWALVAGWILPTAVNSLLFAFLVLPALHGVPGFHTVLTASHPEQALALLVTAVVAGLMLSALQTPLYRVLEGYTWPPGLRRRRIGRHQQTRSRHERELRLAQLTRREKLDSLSADQVRKDVDTGRASVDFFVCLIYGHVVVILAAIAALAVDPSVGPAVAIVAAAGLSVAWYWLAVQATDEWAAAVRGLVDLGRKPLADALGLDLPDTVAQERQMWTLVSRRGRRAYGDWAAELDKFRAQPDPAAGGQDGG